MFSSIVDHNYAGYRGGGIRISGSNGHFFATQSRFQHNVALDTGGGLRLFLKSGELRNCLVHSNNATDGGGIYTYASNILFNGVSIAENYARNGGGIYTSASNILFDDVSIAGNHAKNFVTGYGVGGGLFIGEDSNVQIINTAIKGNTATAAGGLKLLSCTVLIKNSTIMDNEAVI